MQAISMPRKEYNDIPEDQRVKSIIGFMAVAAHRGVMVFEGPKEVLVIELIRLEEVTNGY